MKKVWKVLLAIFLLMGMLLPVYAEEGEEPTTTEPEITETVEEPEPLKATNGTYCLDGVTKIPFVTLDETLKAVEAAEADANGELVTVLIENATLALSDFCVNNHYQKITNVDYIFNKCVVDDDGSNHNNDGAGQWNGDGYFHIQATKHSSVLFEDCTFKVNVQQGSAGHTFAPCDVTIKNCDFTGQNWYLGDHYGDLTIEGCTNVNRINANSTHQWEIRPDSHSLNGKGEPSTLTVKNCKFIKNNNPIFNIADRLESQNLLLYGNVFQNYVWENNRWVEDNEVIYVHTYSAYGQANSTLGKWIGSSGLKAGNGGDFNTLDETHFEANGWKQAQEDVTEFKDNFPTYGYQAYYVFPMTHATIEKTDITITKLWDDENNIDKKRPQEIYISLFADSKLVEKVKLTEDNFVGTVEVPGFTYTYDKWTYTFKDLPKTTKTGEIKYTITEDVVADYDTTYPDDLTVLNTRIIQHYYEGMLKIRKVYQEDGKSTRTNKLFYARVYEDEDLTTPYTDVLPLSLNGTDTITIDVTVALEDLGEPKTYYVAEVDERGNVLQSTKKMSITIDNPAATVELEVVPVVTITNNVKKEVDTADTTSATGYVVLFGACAAALVALMETKKRIK